MKKIIQLLVSILLLLFVNCTNKDIEPDPDEGSVFENGPYQHVTPAIVETEISVGVIAAIPTEIYTGSMNIETSTTIENKIINGCLRIDANHVTISNCIINCDGLYPIKVENGHTNFKIEYSRITCGTDSKVFFFSNGAPNAIVAYNEIIGGQDFFFIQGNLDGMVVKNNYMHTLVGDSSAHADGFQIGQSIQSTGNIHIQGNYFDPDNTTIGKTGFIFGTHFSEVNLLIEDNFIEPWGHFTIRCGSATQCTIKNNVFSQAFDGSQGVKHVLLNQSSQPITFSCNRYADGTFLEKIIDRKDVLSGIDHTLNNCAEFSSNIR